MIDDSDTDNPREMSNFRRTSLRHLAKLVLRVASWIFGAYKTVSKLYDFAKFMWTSMKAWLD